MSLLYGFLEKQTNKKHWYTVQVSHEYKRVGSTKALRKSCNYGIFRVHEILNSETMAFFPENSRFEFDLIRLQCILANTDSMSFKCACNDHV